MSQSLKTLQIVKQLHHIYPDIEGQLCSRHSTLFGKLKTSFNKLYDDMQPNHYVIVKASCSFVEQQLTELKLSMTIQNGVIILVSKTYPTSEIYVNSNHFSEELIFSHDGKLADGLSNLSDEMQTIIKDASQNLPINQLNGGIMYIHANIPEDEFCYKQTLLISFYLAVLSINDNLKYFTKERLIEKMSKLNFMGSKQDLQRHFLGYKNRKFNLALPDLLSAKGRILNQIDMQENSSFTEQKKTHKLEPSHVSKSQLLLDMNKDYKFLFCKLLLGKEDVNYEFRRRDDLIQRKKQLLKELKGSNQINSLFELFHKASSLNLSKMQFKSVYIKSQGPRSMQQLQLQDQYNILNHPNKFLQVLLKQIDLVSQFSNQKIGLEQLINQIWQINSKYLKIHSDEVVELVQEMKQRLQIQGCMVVNQDFLMIVVHKNKYSQLLFEIMQKMNKGELKSKSLFKIDDQQLIVQRWTTDKVIGEKMFTSVPSQGVGIFDPSEAIWFH